MSLLQMVLVPLQTPAPPLVLIQQGRPTSPHFAQVPALHRVWAAVQTPVLAPFAQQGRPAPPQVPQVPALQIPPPTPTHAAAVAIQIPDTQQPPPLQLFPSQQGVPDCPQAGAAPLVPAPPVPPSMAACPPIPLSVKIDVAQIC